MIYQAVLGFQQQDLEELGLGLTENSQTRIGIKWSLRICILNLENPPENPL